mgnify:CR=1 FL=1
MYIERPEYSLETHTLTYMNKEESRKKRNRNEVYIGRLANFDCT